MRENREVDLEDVVPEVVCNGAGEANGANGKARELPYDLNKVEVLRLLVQSLDAMGYSESARFVEKDTGTQLQSPAVTSFREGILAGDWEKVEKLLPDLQVDERVLVDVKFLIYEQQFMELLEKQKTDQAIKILRTELSPLNHRSADLHRLTSFIMFTDPATLRENSGWDGAKGQSRQNLLIKFQDHLPPSLYIPENRLFVLLNQAMTHQKLQCTYHNTLESNATLLKDHMCSQNQFPSETHHILDQHSDEVWYVEFSHDGKSLASTSKDKTAIVWAVEDGAVTLRCKLTGHTASVSFLSWSPNDNYIVTCGGDTAVKLWDPMTGECLRTIQKHVAPVTACAWMSDSEHFVTGSTDKNIFQWNLEGNLIESWGGSRVNDLAITPDDSHMIAVCPEKKIRLYNLADGQEGLILEQDSVTSLCLSKDGKHILLNVANQELHIWDFIERRIVKKLKGLKQGKFVIRSTFGGTDEAFVASGSEDSQVYIWHRKGALLRTLGGHTGTVNSVSWNPCNPYMIASASDDRTIRIWGLSAEAGQSNNNQ